MTNNTNAFIHSVSVETLYRKCAQLLSEFPCILRTLVLSLKYQLNNPGEELRPAIALIAYMRLLGVFVC